MVDITACLPGRKVQCRLEDTYTVRWCMHWQPDHQQVLLAAVTCHTVCTKRNTISDNQHHVDLRLQNAVLTPVFSICTGYHCLKIMNTDPTVAFVGPS